MTYRLPLGALALLTAIFASASANADIGPYGSIQLGLTKLDLAAAGADIDTNSGLSATGALGYSLPGPVRIEAEAGYVQGDVDETGLSGDANLITLFANAFVDIPSLGLFKPYVGAGVGGARVGINTATLDDSDMVFAWNASAGVRSSFDGRMVFTLEYRYMDAADAELGGTDFSAKAHTVRGGVRIPF